MHLSSTSAKLSSNSSTSSHPLYLAQQLQQKSVAALRTAFNHWIRSLPMQERFLALKIYSANIPTIIRHFLINPQHRPKEAPLDLHNHKPQPPIDREATRDSKRPPRKLEKAFYDSLVLISDGQEYLDHIGFEFGLLECPDKLFDLLVAPLNNPGAKIMAEAISDYEKAETVAQRLLSCNCLQEIADVTLKYLRQQILLRFRESMLDGEFLARSLEEEKRRKKEFSTHLKHLSQEARREMILLGFEDLGHLKKWFAFQEISLDLDLLDMEVEDLLKLQKNQFSNRIFKCKLKRSVGELVCYHEQIYLYWKKEAIKNRKRKFGSKTSSEKVEKVSMSFAKTEEKQSQLSHMKKKRLRRKKSASLSIESNETNVTEQDKGVQKPKMLNDTSSDEFLSPKIEEKSPESTRETHECVPPQALRKKKNHKRRRPREDKEANKDARQSRKQRGPEVKLECESTGDFLEQIRSKQMVKGDEIGEWNWLGIGEQLQDFADKISEQANVLHERRMVAFERVQYLLSCYYVPIELFGSCASGIAIRSSDIDIAVKSDILAYFNYLPDHLRLHGALQNLQQILSSQLFISEIKVIDTAAIPIIKLKIDTSQVFLNQEYGQAYLRLNREHNSGTIQADITIETVNVQSQSNHLGIISTQTINGWLKEIPSLHYIVIVLKMLLQGRDLHGTYQGGLNTFSMIVMLVAYIYHAHLQEETNPAVVLERVLHFYGYQFDEKQIAIDLLRQSKDIFCSKKEQGWDGREKADLQVMDPKCNGKNMTRKCYLFPRIKQFMRQMHLKCFEMRRGSQEEGRQNCFEQLLHQ